MPNLVHDTAIICKGAFLDGDNIEVGAYSYVGPNVKIGNNCKISTHCVIEGNHNIVNFQVEVLNF